MNITPSSVKKLLNTLVTPEYDTLIKDYDVILRQNDEGKVGVGIDVNMYRDSYLNIPTGDYITELEGRIRNVMKYLSPGFVVVEFNVIEDLFFN
tara:strand:+ start:55 stop:336 length:282 start_codon:yes stop_codon:yes gene_type:complete